MSYPTLLDIAKLNEGAGDLIEESIQGTPEVSGLNPRTGEVIPNVAAARTIKGTQYKTRVRTALPSASFRDANEGATRSKSTFENRLVETFVLNPRIDVDKAVADAFEDGWQEYLAIEGVGQIEAAMRTLGKQFYYGRGSSGDAKGHPGLIDAVDDSMIVDAEGTTESGGSSIWLVKFGPRAVQWVFGSDGAIELSDVRIGDVIDDDSNPYTAYIQELLLWAGVQVGSKNVIAQIKNVTAQTGKTATDDLIYQALEKFPSGIVPDAIFMTRRSQRQIRESRTATNATGTPAPLPMDVEGIPLLATDSILNTEAISA